MTVLAKAQEQIKVEADAPNHNLKAKEEGKMVKTRCEIYSRVVGYLRPIDQWNEGKASEFSDRKTFDINKKIGDD